MYKDSCIQNDIQNMQYHSRYFLEPDSITTLCISVIACKNVEVNNGYKCTEVSVIGP